MGGDPRGDVPKPRPEPHHDPEFEEESEHDRLARNWNELLQELRVSQTGVQILFAFLLGVAFTQPFSRTTDVQRAMYFVSLLSTACAVALLIAPVAYHRLLFRRRARPELIRAGNRFAIGGLCFIALAIISAVFLVTDFVLGRSITLFVACGLAGWFLLWWLLVPYTRRRRRLRAARSS
ncbi:MAG TPA: DUF6328 family protein [Segeticoccus sp.]|uniref:DUF6328 family protein n=1 Tax=Segeticoccus sp. TaxID=2706531 RepID=UPI002D7F0D13|nr:DUF6328 family protein [Segeticoccus sp.]HET8601660.1 DUF6328 family protein [Segeticoccus sp.]